MRIGFAAAGWLLSGAALRHGALPEGHLFSMLPMGWRAGLQLERELPGRLSTLLQCRLRGGVDLRDHMEVEVVGPPGSRVMIKVADLNDEDARVEFEREQHFRNMLAGPAFVNTIRASRAWTSEGEVGLIMMENADTTLTDFISTVMTEGMTMNMRRIMIKIMVDLLRALVELDQNWVAHRDIQPANILLVGNISQGETCIIAKLTDFGCAGHVFDLGSWTSDCRRSKDNERKSYMAPEIFTRMEETPLGWLKADIWSLGMVFVEMLTGTLPFGWDRAATPSEISSVDASGLFTGALPSSNSGSSYLRMQRRQVGWLADPQMLWRALEEFGGSQRSALGDL